MEWFVIRTIGVVIWLTLGSDAYRENLALNKSAAQSSTLYYSGIYYQAGYAVDGNNSTMFFQAGCSHTDQTSFDSWWSVDLGTSYIVDYLRIFTMEDGNCNGMLNKYCKDGPVGFSVYVGTLQPATTGLCYHSTDTTLPVVMDLNCSMPLQGRYVTITLSRTSTLAVLTLCEVEVYGIKLGATAAYIPTIAEYSGDTSTIFAEPILSSTPPFSSATITETPAGILSATTAPITLNSEASTTTDISSVTFPTISELEVSFTTTVELTSSPVPNTVQPTTQSTATSDITYKAFSTIVNKLDTFSTITDTPECSTTTTDKAEHQSTITGSTEPFELTATSDGSATSESSSHPRNQNMRNCSGCECSPSMPVGISRDQYMSKILSDLEIDKTKLSTIRRKYESDADDRLSAKCIGFTGVLVTMLIFGGVVFLDLQTLARNLHGLSHKINNSSRADDMTVIVEDEPTVNQID